VSASFDQEELSLAYIYWPIQQPRYALGIGIGARLVKVTAVLEVLGRELSEKAGLSAPLPFFDLEFRYGITPKTRLSADFGLLTAEIGDYDGLHAIIGLKIEHLTWKHCGFGAGLNWQKAKVDTRQERFTGRARMESTLLQAFARARW
jgi:hypothetical protein